MPFYVETTYNIQRVDGFRKSRAPEPVQQITRFIWLIRCGVEG
jgi:hypothetical protein